MSRTIKLDDQVYNRLEQVRSKRETFSQVVERLLSILEAVKGISPKIDPAQVNQEFAAKSVRARGYEEL